MTEQLTTVHTCKQKTTYHTNEAAKRSVKRRNKAAGYKYLRRYQCNACNFWHVTTQEKVGDVATINPTDATKGEV